PRIGTGLVDAKGRVALGEQSPRATRPVPSPCVVPHSTLVPQLSVGTKGTMTSLRVLCLLLQSSGHESPERHVLFLAPGLVSGREFLHLFRVPPGEVVALTDVLGEVNQARFQAIGLGNDQLPIPLADGPLRAIAPEECLVWPALVRAGDVRHQ